MKFRTRTEMQNKNKSWISPCAVIVSLVAMFLGMLMFLPISPCGKPHNGTRQLAIDLGKKIYNKICTVEYGTSLSCGGGKDIQAEADLGTVAYIYIYGITDKAEIDELIMFANKFRDKRDKRIPVELTFYGGLDKSHQLKHIKLKGECNAND